MLLATNVQQQQQQQEEADLWPSTLRMCVMCVGECVCAYVGTFMLSVFFGGAFMCVRCFEFVCVCVCVCVSACVCVLCCSAVCVLVLRYVVIC